MSLRIIAGKFKGRILKTPKSIATRPTQGMLRGAVFNMCQNVIERARFLDLFAGSGAMGFEALSRGASHATFIEKDRRAIACIRENIAQLQIASQTTLVASDAHHAISRLFSPYEVIYVDPPYDTLICPFIEALLEHRLFASDAFLFVEERAHPNPVLLSFPPLVFQSTRRFGDALLHAYRFLNK